MNRKPRKYPMRPIQAPRDIGRFWITSATHQTWPYQSLVLTLKSTGPVDFTAHPRSLPVTVREDGSSVVIVGEKPS